MGYALPVPDAATDERRLTNRRGAAEGTRRTSVPSTRRGDAPAPTPGSAPWRVHHTDGNRRNQALTNLALLHGYCHDEVHRERCGCQPWAWRRDKGRAPEEACASKRRTHGLEAAAGLCW